MATQRVIAYHSHEYELAAAAQNVLAPVASTDSYLVGDATDAGIEAMREAGVLVEVLPEPETSSPFSFGVGAGLEAAEDLTTGYYTIVFLMPVTEEMRTALEAAGVRLRRHVPPNGYTAYLTPEAVNDVRSMPFVGGVRRYGADETARAFKNLEAAVAGAVPENMASYEVRPDRREDMATLMAWLRDHNVDFERRARVVRITVPADSPVPKQIEALDVAAAVLPIEPIFDLRLHDAEQREALVQWLKARNIHVIGASRTKVRVRLDGDDGSKYEAIRTHDSVEQIDPYLPPYLDNDAARVLLGVDRKNNAAIVSNIALTGDGEIIGVADTGIDATHADLHNQILKTIARGRPGNASDPHGHGTHVSGSICGDGTASNGAIRGVAPGAKLVVQSLLDASGALGGLPLDLNDLFLEAYQEGVRIHNNSWGAAFGGEYAADSEEVDQFVYDHPDMLVMIAAGNEGTAASPVTSSAGFVDLLSLGVPATAKNALTIGASRSDRTSGGYTGQKYGTLWAADFPAPPIADQTVSGDAQCLAAFSSRGPCTDQRMKPELVAPGTDIVSTRSSTAPNKRFWGLYASNNAYAYMGGTSMATPLATGCAALVREYYRTKRNHMPSAALLKATLINGGRWLTGADANADHPKAPNYHQGFGFLSMPDVIPQDVQPAFQLDFWDGLNDPQARFDATGQQRQFRFTTAAAGDIRVCMTWTDPPARSIQNILHVMLEKIEPQVPGKKNPRWLGNEDRPTGPVKMLDHENNAQVIRVANAPAGNYMVQVWNTVLLKKPQTFALVVTRQP